MLIGLAAAGVALAGCGDETIDSAKVEDFIRDEARVPAAIESVSCPEGRDVSEGDTFECTIAAKDGSEEAVTIRQTDDDGTVTIVSSRQTKLPPREDVEIVPENVEELIRSAAEEPETIVSIDCPSGVPVEKDRSFECVVRYTDGSKERVEITQRDDLGNVQITGTR